MELSKEELISNVIALENRLHGLQGVAENTGRYSDELPNVKSALDKMRLELLRVSAKSK